MRTFLCLTLVACGGAEFIERPTQAVIDPAKNEFWDLPMPDDLRREADGSVDLEKWPKSRDSDLLIDWFDTANLRLREGWGVSSGVFMRMSGKIDPTSLPADARASKDVAASVFLLNVDPGSPERGLRIPIEVSIAPPDRYTPANLLAAIPVFGFVRRPNTLYALVVTNRVRDESGQPIGRTRAFHDGFEGDSDLEAHFAPLRETLEQQGFPLDEVAGAAVFKTLDPNRALLDLIAWAEAQPTLPLVGPWVQAEEYERYRILTNQFRVPVIQRGRRPYNGKGEGLISRDANGDPQIVETQDVRLILAVPKTAMPRDGFPLMMYLHGSGGEAYEFSDRGPLIEDRPRDEQPDPARGTGPAHWLAQRGVASVGFDFSLHGTRHNPPDTTGLQLYNLFGNISATLDNFTVAVMEVTMLSRLLLELKVDPSLAPDTDASASPDGQIYFDPQRLGGMGQSMGTTLGTVWAGVDPRLKGFYASGGGGVLVEIAVSAVEPVTLKGVAELALRLDEEGAEVHLAHPALHGAQNLWDLVDPVVKARHVVLEPHPGIPPKHIVMTAGHRDGYFHPRSQAALAVQLGVELVGDPVEDILPDRLDLAGRARRSYPLLANVNGRSAAVSAYVAPNTNGHYVAFNQPGVRFQYSCFMATLGIEGGGAWWAPAGLEDPCP